MLDSEVEDESTSSKANSVDFLFILKSSISSLLESAKFVRFLGPYIEVIYIYNIFIIYIRKCFNLIFRAIIICKGI